jgi:hypothetical protein
MAAEGKNGEVVSTQGECTDCNTTESSFDELARGLAHGTISRGRALCMLGAALVGGAFASIPGAAWAACKPLARKCTANTQCCSRNCIKNPQGNGKICGCPTGKTLCGGRCVTNCTAPKVLNTDCQCVCPSGQTTCGGACTDLLSDLANCGSCGNACPEGSSCVSGDCVELCPTHTCCCSCHYQDTVTGGRVHVCSNTSATTTYTECVQFCQSVRPPGTTIGSIGHDCNTASSTYEWVCGPVAGNPIFGPNDTGTACRTVFGRCPG